MEGDITRFLAVRVEMAEQGSTLPQFTPDDRCAHAKAFEAWAAAVCRRATEQETALAINQAKLVLLDAYFSWRVSVPNAHRDRTSARGHRCIWHVFLDCYTTLRQAELALAPPPFSPPPTLPSEPGGIFIGDLHDDEA